MFLVIFLPFETILGFLTVKKDFSSICVFYFMLSNFMCDNSGMQKGMANNFLHI